MTFVFDKSFHQAMESNSKMFDRPKPSVIILLHQSKIIPVQISSTS